MIAASAFACTGRIEATSPAHPPRAGGPPMDPATPGAVDPGGPPAGGSGPVGEPDPACQAAGMAASPARLRRLTPEEHTNTVRDLLAAPKAAPQYEAAVGDVVTELEVERFGDAAHALVALGGHLTYLPCDAQGAANEACAQAFIASFGKAAFRRPLAADEAAWLGATYTKLRGLPGVTPAITFHEAIDALAEVILQAPQHVYLQERGVADPSLPAGVRRMTGPERAARLSYLMWSSMPDAALTAAADDGRLDSAAGVRAEAERLLASPRARTMVRRFASDWLELDAAGQHQALEVLAKSAERFPFDAPELRRSMRAETEALYERAFFDRAGSWKTLLTTTDAYVDAPLAALYGVAGAGAAPAWVTLDPGQRAGLFTRAAFLTAHATADFQAPIRRGVFLFRHALCQPLPDPPPDADNTPPVPKATSPLRSVRALTDAKTSGGTCSSCHATVNPLGYALESYDAMGRWQTEERGSVGGQAYVVPVDATATLDAGDLEGTLAGGVALSAALADSQLARDCVVERWFAKALARAPGPADMCLLQQLGQRLRTSDDLRDLVLSLAASDAALFIKETP
jgi:hypothetical protein